MLPQANKLEQFSLAVSSSGCPADTLKPCKQLFSNMIELEVSGSIFCATPKCHFKYRVHNTLRNPVNPFTSSIKRIKSHPENIKHLFQHLVSPIFSPSPHPWHVRPPGLGPPIQDPPSKARSPEGPWGDTMSWCKPKTK